jgi:hypothetical protein
MKRTIPILCMALLLCSGAVLHAQVKLGPSVLAAGGTASMGANTVLLGTFGQPVTGRSLATMRIADLGFWPQVRAQSTTSAGGPDVAPTAWRLEQNHPNPFSATTTILFTVPHAAQVRLIVVDALGRTAVTLVDATLAAGSYSVRMHAAALASGVYLYRLQGATCSIDRMMIITR